MAKKFLTCSATSEDKKSVRTAEGTAMYAFVFRPYTRKGRDQAKQDPKYSIQLLIPKKCDVKALRTALRIAGEEKFGSKFSLTSSKYKVALRDGDDMAEDNEIYADHWVIQAKSKDKPGVVDEFREPLDDETDFYSGCVCRVTVRAFAYDNETKGVGFALNNVQKLRDGTRLSGKPSAEEDFEDADGDDDDERPRKKRRRDDDDDDEEEKPRKKRRTDDDDDEDERPAKRKKRSRDDDDEED